MKTGLLSMHRVNNYGSFWQAYCLKGMIEGCGSNVEFIDIIYGRQFLDEQPYKRKFCFSKILKIPYYLFQRKKGQIFNEYQTKALGIREKNYSSDYDCIIIGSDEVFNCVQQSPWGFTPQLYGKIENDNVNSYAGSFGYTTKPDIDKYHLGDDIAAALSNLKNISVRDLNSENIVHELCDDRKTYRHLDPVLIGDLPIPKDSLNSKEKYIIIYSYDFRFSDDVYIQKIKEFASANNLRIYSVGFYQKWVDKNIVTDPFTLLKYFNNSEFVITDTFHGTIFSIRCHKRFVTIVRNTNTQKLTSLLENVNLSHRIVDDPKNLLETLKQEIKYDTVDELLKQERTRSEEYLSACLYKKEITM